MMATLHEVRDGVIQGLGWDEEAAARAMQEIIVHTEDVHSGAAFCRNVLRPLLERHRPDLVVIDPAFSYLGGNASEQAVVSAFLRQGVQPLLREFKCGAIIIHHTNKPPTGQQKVEWTNGDFAYAFGLSFLFAALMPWGSLIWFLMKGWGVDVATGMVGLLLGGCSAMLGLAIVLRDRQAFVLGTVVTLNPILWIINITYLSHRWDEFSENRTQGQRPIALERTWRFILSRTAEVSRAVQGRE